MAAERSSSRMSATRRFPSSTLERFASTRTWPTGEQGSGVPGRVHQSVGRVRSAVEQTDWHDRAERAFLTAVASRLHVGLTKGETRALIMIASPRALGMIREVYSPVVRNAIRAEVGKDLVKLPVDEIEKQLFP